MPKSVVFASAARDFVNVFDARFCENPLLGHAPSGLSLQQCQCLAGARRLSRRRRDGRSGRAPFVSMMKGVP